MPCHLSVSESPQEGLLGQVAAHRVQAHQASGSAGSTRYAAGTAQQPTSQSANAAARRLPPLRAVPHAGDPPRLPLLARPIEYRNAEFKC